MAKPSIVGMTQGLLPRLDDKSLYVALAMLGATVMPHNLYLQSAPVNDERDLRLPIEDRLKRSYVSTGIALNVALLLNGAIVVIAATVFDSRSLAVALVLAVLALIFLSRVSTVLLRNTSPSCTRRRPQTVR